MKTALTLILVLFLCGPAGTQDLPPDILADQYLLEASKALEKDDIQAALQSFRKIEALEVEPPPEFAFFYGKMLMEHSMEPGELLKGQALLKEFVISAGRGSAHYTPALELLSEAEAKIAAAEGPEMAMAMVRVEGGSFIMGCTPEQEPCADYEKTAHRVQVGSFEIGRFEVTQELWAFVMGENHPWDNGSCPRCPISVTWDDTQAFLQKLNAQKRNAGGGQYRLPSEAEWEYAARGGPLSQGYRYAGSNDPDAVAWYNSDEIGVVYAVGQKQANELGLYDMSGNLQEWVQGCQRVLEDGSCWIHIARGGASYTIVEGLKLASRSLGTSYVTETAIIYRSGFRLARSLP